ncbi:MAG: outer membrane protein assembly factor BamB [Gammaproteobacteria bacterium]|nr:outer membrane protein assembly factor BamB [Gammaproteobacteria bacterium]
MSMQVFSRVSALLATLALAAGCASNDPTPPTPLTDLPTAGYEVREVWTHSLSSLGEELRFGLRPSHADGRIFVADHKGHVVALDAQTGSVQWEFDSYEFAWWGPSEYMPFSGGPSVGEGIVAVGTSDGRVLALDAGSGEQRWQAEVTGEVLAPPAIGAGLVVVRLANGYLVALDAASGEVRWETGREIPSLTLRGLSTPVMARDKVIVGFDNGRVVAVRTDDGSTVWESQVSVPGGRTVISELVDVDAEVAVFRDDVYVTGYNGALVNLMLQTGDELWNEELSSLLSPAVDFSDVFIVDEEGKVRGFDRLSGRDLWTQEGLLYRGATAPVIFQDKVVVGDEEGYLHFLNRATGEIEYRIEHDGEPLQQRGVIAGELLVVQSADGDVAAYRLQSRS